MREILFRGKRKNFDNEWIYGFYTLYNNNRGMKPTLITGTEEKCCILLEVIPETVGQYTGLVDKNDKKIFEGDVVLFDYVGENLGVHGTETVVFMSGKFGVEWGTHREFVCLDGFANTTLEIIGNIHDNPELLGGQNG